MKVKILDIHKSDAYYIIEGGHIGRAGVIEGRPTRAGWYEGWFSGEDGERNYFFRVKVEKYEGPEDVNL